MTKRFNRRIVLLFLVALSVSLPLRAVDTSFWEVSTYESFLQGTLENISLSRDGQLRLSPESKSIFDPDETLVLSLVRDDEGWLYFGTGHQGKVFRIDEEGEGKLLFTAPEPDIFALALGPDGDLYVASSPEGKVYRIENGAEGESSVFFDPESKYIWSLVFDAEGRLLVGTGDKGKIFRVTGENEGEVFFDSRQTHIICMALDSKGNLLAGSDPNGLLYRVSADGKGFILYNADLPEIHALAVDSEERIYVAALGTSRRGRRPFFVTQGAAAGSTSSSQGSLRREDGGPPTPGGGSRTSGQSGSQRTGNQALQIPAFTTPVSGRGALYRILPDNSVETLWRSDRESIFGLLAQKDRVMFTTSTQGRVFELVIRRGQAPGLTLLNETQEALATRLQKGSNGTVFAATGNIGKIFRLSSEPTSKGTYLSPVRDARFISQWGKISWRAELGRGAGLEFYVRTGNFERPDATWSDWTGPYGNAEGESIQSPPARYLQWKAEFSRGSEGTPMLDSVSIAYLNQNIAPEIESMRVRTPLQRLSGDGNRSGGRRGAASSGSSRSGSSSSSSARTSGNGKGPRLPVTISWQARDANQDSLVYSLYLRAEGEKEWLELEEELRRTSYTLQPTAIADGKYTAKVVASDEMANPASVARKTERLSRPFLVDNTPPVVKAVKLGSRGVTGVRFTAKDAVSSLRAAEVRIGSQPWKPVFSEDGIVDSKSEVFKVQLHDLASGEYPVALRVHDLAGNVGLGKIVIYVTD